MAEQFDPAFGVRANQFHFCFGDYAEHAQMAFLAQGDELAIAREEAVGSLQLGHKQQAPPLEIGGAIIENRVYYLRHVLNTDFMARCFELEAQLIA